jgi:hypothetical protein
MQESDQSAIWHVDLARSIFPFEWQQNRYLQNTEDGVARSPLGLEQGDNRQSRSRAGFRRLFLRTED